MLEQRFITLNIEANSVRGLVLRGGRVERWGKVPLPSGLIKEGLILQPQAVGQAIDALFKSMMVPKKKVIVSLTGLRSVHRIVTLPRTSRALLLEAIQRVAKKEIPVPLQEQYLSWRPIGINGDEQDFFLVGVPRELLDAEVQALMAGGVESFVMCLKPLALARMVNRRDALIIDLEQGSFSITLFVNGLPAIMRTTIPRSEGGTLEDNILRLTEEILRTVEFYNQGHPDNLLSKATPIFLTGELAENIAASDLLRQGVGYPALPLPAPVECPQEMPIASYAVNIGLALASMPKDLQVEGLGDFFLNILPGEYKTHRLPKRVIFLSLVFMMAIVGLVSIFQVKIKNDAEIKRLNNELNSITLELRQERLLKSKERTLNEDINEAMATIRTLNQEHQTIFARQGRLTGTFQLVNSLLLPGVSLTSVTITSDQTILEGEANEPLAAVNYAKAFEKEGSFTKVNITKLSETSFRITISK